jgi:hypothetical protein
MCVKSLSSTTPQHPFAIVSRFLILKNGVYKEYNLALHLSRQLVYV